MSRVYMKDYWHCSVCRSNLDYGEKCSCSEEYKGDLGSTRNNRQEEPQRRIIYNVMNHSKV